MQTWSGLLLLATPFLVALELRAERLGIRAHVYVLKPLATICILLIALLAPAPVSRFYQTAIALGLLFSLAGDVFLMLPRDRFLAGLLSFLLAHLCYIAAFASRSGAPRSLVVAVVLFAYGVILIRRLYPRLGRYRLPVLIYASVLLLMAAAAVEQLRAGADLRSLAAVAGAILFVISDSLLALDRFESHAKPRQAFVLSTYFAAQWLIALSVAGLAA